MAWVLLHGTPLDPAVWDGVVPELGEHNAVWVPAVDPQPGDDVPQADIAGRLARVLGDGPANLDLVGHSFGGQVALELALAAPHRVRTLTMICARSTPFPPFAAAAEHLRAGDPVDVDAGIARWFTPAEIAADGPAVAYARGRLERADREAWAAALQAIAGYDASARVGAVTVPTKSMAAELDQVSTPESVGGIADLLPAGLLEVLPGASHMSPFTRPADLARRIRESVARADRPG